MNVHYILRGRPSNQGSENKTKLSFTVHKYNEEEYIVNHLRCPIIVIATCTLLPQKAFTHHTQMLSLPSKWSKNGTMHKEKWGLVMWLSSSTVVCRWLLQPKHIYPKPPPSIYFISALQLVSIPAFYLPTFILLLAVVVLSWRVLKIVYCKLKWLWYTVLFLLVPSLYNLSGFPTKCHCWGNIQISFSSICF